MLADEDNIMRIIKYPEGLGVTGFLFLLYFHLMLINIVQQSLKASGTKDALAWYLSPLLILASIYLTYQITVNILF